MPVPVDVRERQPAGQLLAETEHGPVGGAERPLLRAGRDGQEESQEELRHGTSASGQGAAYVRRPATDLLELAGRERS